MNLKIKCDTPKEQVLVLRKFKKLVPECRWGFGKETLDFIPFVEYGYDVVFLYLEVKVINYDLPDSQDNDCMHYPSFTASDFLRYDWKMEDDKDENESLRLGLQKIRENFNKSLNELEESLRVKKESL